MTPASAPPPSLEKPVSRLPLPTVATVPAASRPFPAKSLRANGFLPNLVRSLATLGNFANNLSHSELNPELEAYRWKPRTQAA